MAKLRNILLISLVVGLIAVEVFSNNLFPSNPAQSQHQLTSAEQNAILSILQHGLGQSGGSTANSTQPFPEFIDPQNPGEVAGETIRSGLLGTGPDMSSYTPPTYSSGAVGNNSSTDLLADAIPPAGTALYFAYQDGGHFWYGEGNNVLVIFSNESIRSFNKRTGAATNWLQDRLAYPPISDTAAYYNYQKNYNAEIVAQTSTWVLMKFPSGAVIKVAKPTGSSSISQNQPTVIYGLPDKLPGY